MPPDNSRARLDEARTAVVAETERARAGLAVLARYSGEVDAIVQEIYESAREETATPVALLAIGGYGRRQLCLHSDIDLMIAFDGRIGAAEERFLRAVLHPLWDLRLEVGHQVRELGDLAQVEADNPEFLLAILEARFVAGSRETFDRVAATCLGAGSIWREPMRRALVELTGQRHAQFNRTVFQLEPDVKDSPGSLRDATAIRLLADLDDGGGRSVGYHPGRVREAEDFLLRIRSILHLERKRNYNGLGYELQETVAARFGSPGDQPRRQVEALMSTYFHHAQTVARALAASLRSLQAPEADEVSPLGDELERAWDGMRFTDGTRASLRPRTWLHPFEAALDADAPVSDQALTCIERHGKRYAPERFFVSTDDRDRLLRILRPRPGLYDRLSEMHGCGLLGRMFPEFQKVYCLVIRDFYHKYTVDEHTLQTIRSLEGLCAPKTRSRKRFATLLAELPNPELLVLALLFHDVGKWTNRNHSEEGVRMAAGAMRRIKLPEASFATVEFLIRHHLSMSVAAFRRDVDDPDVVAQFARLVGTEQRLKLLCLMTLVDVDAVAPEVMNPWKEELLWRLYVETYNRLTLEYGDEVIDEATRTLEDFTARRPGDIKEAEVTAFLEGFPQRYLRLVDRSTVYDHVRLSRNIERGDVHCALEEKGSAWELSAVTFDQPRLFADICGVLSHYGMDILRGQAMTNQGGVVLDLFQFADAEGYLRMNPTAPDELTGTLRDVVAGRLDIDAKLRARDRPARSAAPIKPVIHFENHRSPRFTVLEIIARNGWGLLYRVSRAISNQGCDIDLVLIATEGTRAIDVFHLTRAGRKLTNREQDELRAELETTLAGGRES
ncbi:MAG: HD domain-containing protein [Acidobacteria bacterium]|nr:HD domain-containing protein [Acidobacteriota bacterium]